jgi:uncharacterized protein (DUF302 family)
MGIAAEYFESGPSWVFETEQTFDDAKDNLVFAIESRGLVISYVSHASEMLSRTAEAVGSEFPVYGDAEILLFCKADLSHQLVKANPHNITLCPYSIAVYTLVGEPDSAYLAMSKPFNANVVTAPITEMIIDIIEETQEGF